MMNKGENKSLKNNTAQVQKDEKNAFPEVLEQCRGYGYRKFNVF